MATEQWVKATVLGSHYEMEINVTTGEYRHRPLQMELPFNKDTITKHQAWSSGRAPDFYQHQEKKNVAAR